MAVAIIGGVANAIGPAVPGTPAEVVPLFRILGGGVLCDIHPDAELGGVADLSLAARMVRRADPRHQSAVLERHLGASSS